MFIVNGLHRFSRLQRSAMLLMGILTTNISLRWSSGPGVTLRIYKHSAPPELKRFAVAARRPAFCLLRKLTV